MRILGKPGGQGTMISINKGHKLRRPYVWHLWLVSLCPAAWKCPSRSIGDGAAGPAIEFPRFARSESNAGNNSVGTIQCDHHGRVIGRREEHMPTVMRIGPYRLFFVSLDASEPPHVHVRREKMVAKYWLNPVVMERPGGFRAHELREIGQLVQLHRDALLEAWNEFYAN